MLYLLILNLMERSRHTCILHLFLIFIIFQWCAFTTYGKISMNTEKTEIPGCKPLKIWMIIKHGIEDPSLRDIFLISRRLPIIRNIILKHNPTSSNILDDYDLRSFRKWKNKLTPEDYYKLPHEIENQMKYIAIRMQMRFPSLLSKVYSDEVYQFKYADSKRSAYFFTSGLFAETNSNYNPTSEFDPISQFNKLCRERNKTGTLLTCDVSGTTTVSNITLMEQTVEEVNKQLKLPYSTLIFEDIHLMHLICLYETASNISTKSPWCSVFSVHNLKVMRYLEDLRYNAEHGYSKNMNNRRACVAFDDLLTFFQSVNSTLKSTIYFTHSGAVLRTLLFLNLYKNDEFPRKNLEATPIVPFETDLAFILYDCKGVLRVQTMHQELVTRLPSCPSTDLCDLSKIAGYYGKICDFNAMCEHQTIKWRIEPDTPVVQKVEAKGSMRHSSKFMIVLMFILLDQY